MSDQEIVATGEIDAETSTLFDELTGLVPEERLTEYYRVIAHSRTLSPNDEMLRILEAMGVLALLTRETPTRIAVERSLIQEILETSATQASAIESRMEQYTARLESRLAQLPKELETGLDPPRIAKLLGESLRQSFHRSGLPDTTKALCQSCSELNSVQKQLVNNLREVAHPDVGVAARITSANDSLLRNMAARAQQMDDYLVRLEKQVWPYGYQLLRVLHWRWDLSWAHGLRTQDKHHAKLQPQHSRNRHRWSWLLTNTKRSTECSIE